MGDPRQEEVLRDLVARVTGGAERESSFVLLTGDRGVGKTFVGQELYRRLAASQEAPAFWPTDLLDPGRHALEQDRHTVRPARFAIPPDAKPGYVWIGVNCQRAVDGMSFDALGAASVQVIRLRSAIEAALRSGRAGRSRSILLSLLEIATAFGSLADDPTSTALGVALTARSAAEVHRSLSASRAEHDDVAAADGLGLRVDLTTADRATVSTYCDLIEALTEQLGLPTVLFIDDLHHADRTLLALLAALGERANGNLCVLGTAERAVLDTQARVARGDDGGAGSWLAGDRLPRLARVDLERLHDATLAEIVLARAPRTTRATVAALVHRSDGNPYRLRLLLDSPRAQPEGGEIALDPREVAAFPNRIEALYRQAWSFLPAATRRVVAIAAMQGRAVVEDVLLRTCSHLGIEEPGQRLAEARHEQWLISAADGVLVFPDNARHAVAKDEAETSDTLTPEARERAGTRALASALAALRGPLAAWVRDEPPIVADVPAQVLPHLETVATLGRSYPSDAPDDVARLTLAFGGFLTSRGEGVLAAEHLAAVGGRLRTHEPAHASTGVRLELRAAEWWSDCGQLERALDQVERIERDCPPELLGKRELGRYLTFVKGRTLGRSGRPDLAGPLLAGIAGDPEDEDNLGFRSSQVSVAMAADVGLVDDAAGEHLRKTSSVMSQTDGLAWWRDEPHCQELRALIVEHRLRRVNAGRVAMAGPAGFFAGHLENKASVLMSLGLWVAGCDMREDIAAGLVAVAPHHENTAVAMSHRATVLSKLGRLAEALAEHERVIELYERFGRDALPNLLVSRGNRAQTLSRLGRHQEALTELEAVYGDEARTLGREHPSTLHTLMGMARVLGRAGEHERAIEMYRVATETFQAALGPGHPESRQYAATLGAIERGLLSVESIGDDERPDAVISLDERRAASYRRTQAEDWGLLFGTASFATRAKRAAQERLISAGARLFSR